MNQPTRTTAQPLDAALTQARYARYRRRVVWLLVLGALAFGGYRLFEARRAAANETNCVLCE